MIDFATAQKIMKKFAARLHPEVERLDLEDALHRRISSNIYAPEDHPRFDNSAMDGFAVSSNATRAASAENPKVFAVIAKLHAGDHPNDSHDFPVQDQDQAQDTAVEIMTGAPMPSLLFDSVIPIEKTKHIDQDLITVESYSLPGSFVRYKGEDYKSGDLICPRGHKLDSKTLLLLASCGLRSVEVFSKFKAAIIATGNEIVPFDQVEFKNEQIRNITTPFLKSSLTEFVNFGNCHLVADDPTKFKELILKESSQGADLIITTGGVSMGQADFVRDSLLELSCKIIFHKVAIKPGKPILLASLILDKREIIILACPGNPLSTIIASECFLKPLLTEAMSPSTSQLSRDCLTQDEDFKFGAFHPTTQPKGPDEGWDQNAVLKHKPSFHLEEVTCCEDHHEQDLNFNLQDNSKLHASLSIEYSQKFGSLESRLFRNSLHLPLLNSIKKPKDLLCFYKSRLVSQSDGTYIEVLLDQASHRISSLADTDGLVVLPDKTEIIEKGEICEFIFLG